jgi:hypothetical protein
VFKLVAEPFDEIAFAIEGEVAEAFDGSVWGVSGILCAGPVSFSGLEPVSKDDSELGPRFEPLTWRCFPFVACVVENQIQ